MVFNIFKGGNVKNAFKYINSEDETGTSGLFAYALPAQE